MIAITDEQVSGHGWSARLQELRREVSRSPDLRACVGALSVSGVLACAGVPARRALGTGACFGLLQRELLAGLLRVEREARNSGDTAIVAAWLGEATPPLGTWAIEADFGRLVVDAAQRCAGTVVECGSGVTTLLIASALRTQGRGKLYSLEHDPAFAAETSRRLAAMDLSDWVQLIQAPLRTQIFGGVSTDWYDMDCVGTTAPAEIDLLVVDGPPAVQEWSRWPALSVFGDSLAPAATVLLDDGRREGERRAALRWSADRDDLTLSWIDTIKGTWMLRRSPPTAISGGLAGVLHNLRPRVNPMPAGFGRWPVRR